MSVNFPQAKEQYTKKVPNEHFTLFVVFVFGKWF